MPLAGQAMVAASAVFSMVLGNGCFWGRQHDYTELEMGAWGRTAAQVTSVGGYFGGAPPKGGGGSRACYYNRKNESVYTHLGDAEVVSIDVPDMGAGIRDILDVYWKSFQEIAPGVWGREDYFDAGPGYRAVLAWPGGTSNDTIYRAVRSNNPHNMTFRSGEGSDSDTLGENMVWIMDSKSFTFHQAELCLQFRNNQTGKYPASYHALRTPLEAEQKIGPTGCPPCYVC